MFHYVYVITNLINDKKYIGKRSCSCPVEKDNYMGSGTALKLAKKKYGLKNFKKEILKVFNTEKEAYDFEIEIISSKNAVVSDEYYNIAKGGIGCGKGTFKGGKSVTAKKVICLNNEKIFATVKEASEFYKCDTSDIVRCCKDKMRYCGTYNNEKLVWMYYDEYLRNKEKALKKLENDYINHRGYGNSNSKPILCVTTGKTFPCRREAAEYYNIQQIERHITSCCNGKRKSCGKLKDGTKLVWKYI